MINFFKWLVNIFKLRNFVLYFLHLYGRFSPDKIVRRNNVKYFLDLRESVDFATYFGGWEPETIDFINSEVSPGKVIIEVGANVGIQTLHMARRVAPNGMVYAFEPTDFALKKLYKNIELNPNLNGIVEVNKNIVTDKSHNIPISNIRSSWQTDGKEAIDEAIDSRNAISIDEFVFSKGLQRLDILKIDVDGYDYKVLKGAIESINKFSPTIYIELGEIALNNQGDSVIDILNLMSEMGYEGVLATKLAEKIDGEKITQLLKGISHLNAIFKRIL